MRFLGYAALICLTAACSMVGQGPVAAHPLDQTIWAVADRKPVDSEDLFAGLDQADVIIVGELHDNAAHHLAQAEVVAALAPKAIAFEMIPEASEEGIAVFLEEGGKPVDIGPAIGWERIGWPSWSIYRPIFEASTALTYIGGGVARGDAKRAIKEGAATVVRDPVFRGALERDLPEVIQAAMEDQMVASHCGFLPRKAAPGMVEAQRLRDASFAAAVLRARAAADGSPVVLITGNGHTRKDRGVPRYLAATSPDLKVVSIGLLETDPDAADLSAYGDDLPYDFVWFTAPAERDDPCAAFKK